MAPFEPGSPAQTEDDEGRRSVWAAAAAAGAAALISGCATRPLATDASSHALAEVKSNCAAASGCAVISIETHGQFWRVTTHSKLPANTLGGDAATFVIDRRLDRVVRMRVSE